ncbi:sensor histidine kinase [Dongshaea marina]|uniref:sensor histidine kinase n=1 Tax=Dongshaea marina TaxID=2047966 RepID=UPI000D3E84E3|nr:ATP-binding protein [Dongshaea marina]
MKQVTLSTFAKYGAVSFVVSVVVFNLLFVFIYTREVQHSEIQKNYQMIQKDFRLLFRITHELHHLNNRRAYLQMEKLMKRINRGLRTLDYYEFSEYEKRAMKSRLQRMEVSLTELEFWVGKERLSSAQEKKRELQISFISGLQESCDALLMTVVQRNDMSWKKTLLLNYGSLILLILIFCICGLIGFIFLYRRVIIPLTRLRGALIALGEGRFDIPLTYARDDEIGALMSSYNKMRLQLKASTEQLREANAEMESFSYSVSHDLRAPLRSLDGFSQAVLEDYGESLDEVGRDYLERIRNAAKKMGSLIDDILMLSRVGRREMSWRENIDLQTLLQGIWSELTNERLGPEVQFSVEPCNCLCGDPGLIRVLFQNLLGNALKFTSKVESPRVEVICSEEGVICIQDNGAGFDTGRIDKLFTPFQRLHGSHEFVGSGIGLAICKRIVNRHQGEIWAESEEGQGARFYLRLEGKSNGQGS